MEKTIKLSIVMPTYNHEVYIKQALMSILRQEVNFPYEVLVGADVSSDNTHGILREMEKHLPEHFHFFFREERLKMYRNFADLYSRTKGQYLIMLEGDDYWTYEYKLQRQVDFLDENPDYIAVAHNTLVVNEKGIPIPGEKYPECTDDEFTLEHYKKNLFPGQTNTLMYRNFRTFNLIPDKIEFVPYAPDKLLAFMLAANGRVRCIQETWSAYRYVIENSTSWTSQFRDDDDFKLRTVLYHKSMYDYARSEVKTSDSIRISAQIYFFIYFRRCVGKRPLFHLSAFLKEFATAPCKASVVGYILRRIFSRPFKR